MLFDYFSEISAIIRLQISLGAWEQLFVLVLSRDVLRHFHRRSVPFRHRYHRVEIHRFKHWCLAPLQRWRVHHLVDVPVLQLWHSGFQVGFLDRQVIEPHFFIWFWFLERLSWWSAFETTVEQGRRWLEHSRLMHICAADWCLVQLIADWLSSFLLKSLQLG